MLLPVYMYTSYVSSEQLREYLGELQNKGLLSYNKEDGTFITTAHGGEYLKLYAAMDSLGKKRIGMDTYGYYFHRQNTCTWIIILVRIH